MSEPLIKRRKLKMYGLDKGGDLSAVREGLTNKEGILSVDVDRRKNVFRIEYDLKKISFESIERLLNDLGLDLSQKFSERFKRGMAKFTEQNEMDHLNAPVSSCCEDPKNDSNGCVNCSMQK